MALRLTPAPILEWVAVADRLPRGIETPAQVKGRAQFYVLAVDAQNRISVGYRFYNTWTFAKPIGTPVYWMPLPDPPGCEDEPLFVNRH